jgi:threonylcarbamoyladenosine tRNA methylthiotransferase MtaB
MPQVAHPIIKERARQLREAGEAALRARLAAEVGQTRNVLIESATRGRTDHFLPVAVEGGRPGDVQQCVIAAQDGRHLLT